MANLCKELFRLFALGQLHATEVASLAKAAGLDGWGTAHPVSRKLVAFAQKNPSGKNASCQIMNFARNVIPVPEV